MKPVEDVENAYINAVKAIYSANNASEVKDCYDEFYTKNGIDEILQSIAISKIYVNERWYESKGKSFDEFAMSLFNISRPNVYKRLKVAMLIDRTTGKNIFGKDFSYSNLLDICEIIKKGRNERDSNYLERVRKIINELESDAEFQNAYINSSLTRKKFQPILKKYVKNFYSFFESDDKDYKSDKVYHDLADSLNCIVEKLYDYLQSNYKDVPKEELLFELFYKAINDCKNLNNK
ncbi:MAG: hypothetical protein J5762_03705 [Clostridia bacterium]|nr:hypothetical protein [Clostridia bacterium]